MESRDDGGRACGELVYQWRQNPLKVGAIGDWMEARDLPDADGESFRSWFKKHQAQEKKNG